MRTAGVPNGPLRSVTANRLLRRSKPPQETRFDSRRPSVNLRRMVGGWRSIAPRALWTAREWRRWTAAPRPFVGAPLGIAKAAGLAHDLGKYDPRIQAYLRGQGVSVDHSTAGATVLSDPANSAQDQAEAARDCLATEAVVYCILGHQARLPDRSRSPASRISGFARDHLDPAWHEDLSLDFEGVCAELFAHVTPASMAFDLTA